MLTHITTEDAKRQDLPGFDVYRNTHSFYFDDMHRDHGVIQLNLEALKAFSDTVTLACRHELAATQAAVREWHKAGLAANLPPPLSQASIASMKFVNYENLKIASGFELHLKARLLGRDFVLHQIDSKAKGYKDLAAEQRFRPIPKSELIAINSYYFDGRQNYLPGLKEGSIKFSQMTDEPQYRSALGLSDEALDIIGDYRSLRNQIHLPGDFLDTPHIRAYAQPIINFLTNFINAEIIHSSSQLIARHDWKIPLPHPYD